MAKSPAELAGFSTRNEAGDRRRLSAVSLTLEVEVQVHDAPLEGALEALLVAVLPLLVQDLEGYVLVRRPSAKYQQARAAVLICIRILEKQQR